MCGDCLGPLTQQERLLATAVELSAFDKYDVIEHNVSRSELAIRGIDGKTIPMQLLFEVKKNEDGSYLKHKCRCILLGQEGTTWV